VGAIAGERVVKIKFTGETSGLNGAANSGEQSMSRLKASTVAFGTAAGIALEKAGQALFQFGKQSIAAFEESEQAQTKLADAFTRFPNIADTSISRLNELNATLAKTTKFDDDATAAGQAMLAQFGLTGAQLEQLTPLMQDFAAKTGMDVTSAASALGKALLGQGRALKQVGIDFVDAGSVGANFDEIMTGLNEKVGGFAEVQGKTAAGQAAILSNQFGELKEQVGAQLLPAMLKLTEAGLKVIDFIQQNKTIMLPLIGIIAAVTAVQWAWNIAMTANPIGLIIVGIAALIAAIVWIATKTTWFQDIWRVAWTWIKNTAVDVWEWLKALPERIGSVFSSISNFISAPFRAAFNFIVDAWNNTIGKLRWSVPSWVPFIGGNTIAAPTLRRFHSGGVVPGPFGREVPILARAGEVVSTAEQAAGLGDGTLFAEIDLGEGISQVVEIKLRKRERQIARSVFAGAGAR
jgi:hypothetical protein